MDKALAKRHIAEKAVIMITATDKASKDIAEVKSGKAEEKKAAIDKAAKIITTAEKANIEIAASEKAKKRKALNKKFKAQFFHFNCIFTTFSISLFHEIRNGAYEISFQIYCDLKNVFFFQSLLFI